MSIVNIHGDYMRSTTVTHNERVDDKRAFNNIFCISMVFYIKESSLTYPILCEHCTHIRLTTASLKYTHIHINAY